MTMSNLRYKPAAGETFDRAALAVYGDERFAEELLMANPEQAGKTVFAGNEVLRLPIVQAMPGEEDGEIHAVSSAPWKE